MEFATDSAFQDVRVTMSTDSASIELPVLELEEPLLVRVQAVTADGLRGLPLQPHPIQMAPHWGAGRVLREQGNLAGSLDEFEIDLERFPENPHLLRDIGWSLYLLGRHTQARDVFEQARVIAPEYDELLVELARTYFWLNDFREAEAIYLEIMERRSDYADAFWGLGDTYRVGGARPSTWCSERWPSTQLIRMRVAPYGSFRSDLESGPPSSDLVGERALR